LIQVRYCWGGSSFSKRARQKRQKLFIGMALLFEAGLRREGFSAIDFILFEDRYPQRARSRATQSDRRESG
jgi:hypothetical protein